LFTVGAGVTLILEDIVLEGFNTNQHALVVIEGEGTLEMKTGSVIKDNNNTATGIPGFGGGVLVRDDGFLLMNGGSITDNIAFRGGGVHVSEAAVLEINSNSVIHGNHARFNDALDGAGGGIQNFGTVNMYGGTISGNTTQSIGHGGGVFNRGFFYMHGGEITGNSAHHGGGVRNNPGSIFEMYDGAEIHGNNTRATSDGVMRGWGAGIDNRGLLTMFGGDIYNNNALGVSGGVNNGGGGMPGTFYMHDGRIYGNTAGQEGGGMENWDGSFYMTGGIIYGNETNFKGEPLAAELKNNAPRGAAINVGGNHTTQYGTFIDSVFTPTGNILRTNSTVSVEAGVLWRPPQPPPTASLQERLDWLFTDAEDDTEYNLELIRDEELTTVIGLGAIGSAALNLPRNKNNVTITLYATGQIRTITHSSVGVMFRIPAGVTLVLDNNVTLQGRPDNNNHLVRIEANGTFIMRNGSMITGNVNSATTAANGGSAVRVTGDTTGAAPAGLFIMEGGTITGNSTTMTANVNGTVFGAGVHVNARGVFEMRGGVISNNSSMLGGGVGLTQQTNTTQPTFRMSGGIIYGNNSAPGLANISTATQINAAGDTVSTRSPCSALYVQPPGGTDRPIVQRGIFDGTNFIPTGDLYTSDYTLSVDNNGILTGIPAMAGNLGEQLSWLQAFAQSGESYLIDVSSNQALIPDQSVASMGATSVLPIGRSDITITLSGSGAMRTISLPSEAIAANQGSLFVVPSGVTLVLDRNIKLLGRGGAALAGNNQPLVRINGGILRLNEGTMITGNSNSTTTAADLGGGVRILPAGGTLILDGGIISGNTVTGGASGAGVHVTGTAATPGVVNMLRGEIIDNTATGTSSAGGVLLGTTGSFLHMFGGEISNNEATNATATADAAGGVRVLNLAVFNMRGGEISGNTVSSTAPTSSGGISVANGGRFQISDGTITGINANAGSNTGVGGPAVLYRFTPATGALTGTFDGNNDFIPTPNGALANNDLTIEVIDGILTIPSQPPATAGLAAQLAWHRGFGQGTDDIVIELSSNETLSPAQAMLPPGRTVILRGIGGFRDINLAVDGNLFSVTGANTRLVLEDIILRGRTGDAAADRNITSLVRIGPGGILHMKDGSRITGNWSTGTGDNLGGGVRILNGGTLTIEGGIITGNTASGASAGGGVHVTGAAAPNNGIINFIRGEISNNTAIGNTSAGGVFLGGANSFLNMEEGGKITGNSSTATGAQISAAGGVRINGSATFNMRGGEISNNHTVSTSPTAAGGVSVLAGGFFRISKGFIYGNDDLTLANTSGAGAFNVLSLVTAATGAQHGTYTGIGGGFVRVGDLVNGHATIEVNNGQLIRP
jgi:hypothetical protein